MSIWYYVHSIEKLQLEEKPHTADKIYQLKINPWVDFKHLSSLNLSKPPTDESSANKDNESRTHPKPDDRCDQIHSWIQHINTPK